MTPFFVPDPSILLDSIKVVEVPTDIREFCTKYTVPTIGDQVVSERWRYVDCVWKHMGYYGDDLDRLEKSRKRSVEQYLEIKEERRDKVSEKVDQILNKYFND